MRTVYVMRHCKSRWDQAEMPDADRKLSPRGKRDASAMGTRLAQDLPAPDLVVTSDARRARKTAERVAETWGYAGEIQIDTRLYEGSRQGWLSLLRGLGDEVHTVLIVGHNPHVEEMVFMLGDRTVPMPTGAVVSIELAIDRWSYLQLPADGSVRRVWQAGSGMG